MRTNPFNPQWPPRTSKRTRSGVDIGPAQMPESPLPQAHGPLPPPRRQERPEPDLDVEWERQGE